MLYMLDMYSFCKFLKPLLTYINEVLGQKEKYINEKDIEPNFLGEKWKKMYRTVPVSHRLRLDLRLLYLKIVGLI